MKKGKFIVIDGMDGSGKTTEIRLLKNELKGHSTLFTYEPGGTPHADTIRAVLLSYGTGVRDALTDFFLFWAARASHVEEVVRPALAKGTNVIYDRFDSSTYAFQIGAEEHPELEEAFWACRKAVLGECVPDAYIILDLPPSSAMKRRESDTSKALTVFDTQKLDYHTRARAGYKKFKPDSNVYIVDSSVSAEETHANVWPIVKQILG